MFVKENPDKKNERNSKHLRLNQDESNFNEHFGYNLRCVTGRKVRRGDACILCMDSPYLTILVVMAILAI